MQRTRLSSKGQIILPKSIRDSRFWVAGMEFTVEAAGDGVLLRPAAAFPHTEMEEVAGCLASKHRVLSASRVQQGIDEELRRRRDSGRY